MVNRTPQLKVLFHVIQVRQTDSFFVRSTLKRSQVEPGGARKRGVGEGIRPVVTGPQIKNMIPGDYVTKSAPALKNAPPSSLIAAPFDILISLRLDVINPQRFVLGLYCHFIKVFY